jgi:ABC-type Fe3+/spermidine/putrescine transport system ATPase subunit
MLAAPGTDVLLAVRPEKIVLQRDGAAGIVGRIGADAYLGERSHLQVTVAGLKEPIAVAVQSGQYLAGTSVSLSWPDEAAIVLPRE